MCSSKTKATPEPKINGRPVLQPTYCNRVSSLETRPSKASPAKKAPKAASPPVSPKLPSPRPPAVKRGKDPSDQLNSSGDKALTRRCLTRSTISAPGSIAAARREQVAIMQEQRKMRIAHYGRTKSAKYEGKSPADNIVVSREQKRCNYITANSDPIYVAYHDEEWGVPVHDDKLLFELLVLTGAQVGTDWTSVLKKRETFREVFSSFDAETVSKYSEKNVVSIAAELGTEPSLVRAAIDNATRIVAIQKKFGSLAEYLWGFVSHKPVSTQYSLSQRIPAKTSKSEIISKDMVKRGFRFVGPTMVHSFMQAVGLTNDHLITCPRHLQCLALASQRPAVARAL